MTDIEILEIRDEKMLKVLTLVLSRALDIGRGGETMNLGLKDLKKTWETKRKYTP